MRDRAMILLLAFSLTFNVTFAGVWLYRYVAADDPQTPPARRAGPAPRKRLWDKLDLTEEQRLLLEESRQKLEHTTEEIRARVRPERDRLFELLQAAPPDRQAIAAAQERLHEAEREMRQSAVAHMAETKQILTPEQRRRLFQLMKAYGERRAEQRRRRRGVVERLPRKRPSGGDRRARRAARPEVLRLLGDGRVTVQLEEVKQGVVFDITSDDPQTARQIKDLLPEHFSNVLAPDAYAGR